MIAAFAVPGGAPISGWTAYPPLSGLGEVTGPGEGMGQTIWIVSILIFCFGSMLGSVNFISTTIDMRAPGMTLMRMPLTVWAWFVTAILSLLAFSVLLAAGILLLLDRSAGTSFFSRQDSCLAASCRITKEGRRYFGSICFGFLAIPRFTLRFFPAWASCPTCWRISRASLYLDIAPWRSRSAP